MIESKCPNCKMIYLLTNDNMKGQVGVCNRCKSRFNIPDPIVWEPLGQNDPVFALPKVDINSNNPGCMIFLIDQSGSMEKQFPVNKKGDKAVRKDAVAEIINKLLYNLTLRCTQGQEIKNRFHIAIYGYGGTRDGKDKVENVLKEDGLKPVSWIAENVPEVVSRKIVQKNDQGQPVEIMIPYPIWLKPHAEGMTPMYAAFKRAFDLISEWIKRYPKSYPPIIFNITDGVYTDGNPKEIVQKIAKLGTSVGKTMVMNCHISDDAMDPLIFPNNDAMRNLNGPQRLLYEISSVLPQNMIEQAQMKGFKLSQGARGFAFNADMSTLVDFLSIGGTLPGGSVVLTCEDLR